MAPEADKRGRVLELRGKTAIVEAGQDLYCCRIPGRLKKGDRLSRSPVTVGDWVHFTPEEHRSEDGESPSGTIVDVDQRRTCLSRPSPHNARLEHALAANVDQLVVVLAADDIVLHLPLLDRLLVAASLSGLSPTIAVNKIDLRPAAEAERELEAYRAMGTTLVCYSAREGSGLEALRGMLRDKTSVIAGPSGVGKSSSLNALDARLELRTDEVRRSGAGKHTTTSARLIPLPWGGYVVDTPGVREFGLWNIPHDELGLWYPDFANYRTRCRYPGCSHTHEPTCAVRTAVESGTIDRGRYERYVQILQELEQERRTRFR